MQLFSDHQIQIVWIKRISKCCMHAQRKSLNQIKKN